MKLHIFFIIIFLDFAFGHVRKFSQVDFNKWLDTDNYVVALFCSSVKDQICIEERQKIKSLSDQMVKYSDIIFGYVEKETDALLISQYAIDKLPMIKFFPYNNPAQNFYLNIPNLNFKEKILEIREQHLKKKSIKATSKAVRKHIKSYITEIESADFESTVKNPEKHVVMILYEKDSNEEFKILEQVAKIFDEEKEVSFYKFRVDKSGALRPTFSFPKDPTMLWYPIKKKEGFVYGGKITFKMLVEYINDHAGLHRNYDGDLKANAGRIPEIDQIIYENIFSILDKTNINNVIDLVQQKSKDIPHSKKYIDYYLGILKEIRKGRDPGQVLNREQEFLNKKVSKIGQSQKETNEWSKYYNIITAFVDFAAKRHQDALARPAKKTKSRKRKSGSFHQAELKEDPRWKARSKHDEL